MLHQHKFCVYRGKRKLKVLITCETVVLFCALTVFILLCINVFRKRGKKVYSRGVLERVGRVTVNKTFFFFSPEVSDSRDIKTKACFWRHLLRWRNAFPARDSLTAAFSLCRFFAFYCFKCYLASFSRYKTVFYPILCPLNMLNKTKLTQNG